MRVFHVPFYILLLITSYMNATEYAFDRISTREGLSQNDVECLFQDSYGYIWIGTNDGLNRFDGYTFKTFTVDKKNPNSISSNIIAHITEDHNKNLWIATVNAGISVYNMVNGQFTILKNSDENPMLLTSNYCLRIFCSPDDNTIYCSTREGLNIITSDSTGNYQVKQVNASSSSPSGLSRDQVNYSFIDSKGNLWVTTYESLDLLIKQEDGSFVNEFHNFFDSSSYFHDFRYILETNEGIIVSHHGGIHLIRPNYKDISSSEILFLSNINALTIALDHQGQIWAGGLGGVQIYTPNPQGDVPYKLEKHFIEGIEKDMLPTKFMRSIIVDNTGVVWIGTRNKGICKYDPIRLKFRTYSKTETPGSIGDNTVRAIFEDSKRNVWFGTEGNGISLLKQEEEKNYYSGFENYSVTTYGGYNHVYQFAEIIDNREKYVLAATGYPSHLVSITKNKKNLYEVRRHLKIDNLSMTLIQDSLGSIWVGTYSLGLFRYNASDENSELICFNKDNSSISTNIIRCLKEDSQGRIWVGTSDGLYMILPSEKSIEKPNFIAFKDNTQGDSSISNNYILPIAETSKKEIWIGTLGGGLNRYIEGSKLHNGWFQSLTMENGLPNNVIKAIVEDDDGDLWISSNKGITRIKNKVGSIRNFDVSDGLQDNEFSDLAGCKLHDGEILFGGSRGFNAFYPEEITRDLSPVKLAFTKLIVANKEIQVGDVLNKHIILKNSLDETHVIKLKFGENNFEIHFSGLHYSLPKNNQYRYKLEGYDKDWISTSSDKRFAKYTNLKPGNYTFSVLASNSDGVWAKEPKNLSINIIPPFWQSWLFRIGVFILLLLFLRIIIRFREKRINTQKDKLAEEVSRQTQKLHDANAMLEEQKEEVTYQKEEVESQRDFIHKQNVELELHRNNLENLVKERTSELEEARLKAEESDRIKSAFLANMSHEIRTPLNAIVGFSSLLSNKNLPEDLQAQYNNLINENTDALLVLIDDILNLSRIEAGQVNFTIEEISINEFLNELISAHSISSEAANIELRINNKVNDKKVKIYSDKIRLQQILSNLLSNAIKFTDDGFVELGFDLKDDEMFFYVKDTGIGISKENSKVVFDRFRKVEENSEKLYRGTGLGLSIVHRLTELLKGKVWVESVAGKGTIFNLILPNEPDALESHKKKREMKLISGRFPDLSGKYILIAEDEHANYLYLRKLLEKTNAEIARARNGQEAVKLCVQSEFDLVFMDIKMPLMDGFEAINRIRKHNPKQVVIAQTAYAMSSDIDKIKTFGFNDYLIKPIKQEHLYLLCAKY